MLIPSAVSRNGSPSPSEYTESSSTPWLTVSLVAASSSTPPSSGPTHGVQPKANAPPSSSEPSFPRPPASWNRTSR